MTRVFLGLVYATPEKFENSVFTLEAFQMFYVRTTSENFERATILDLGFWGKLGEITWLAFSKYSVLMFSFNTKNARLESPNSTGVKSVFGKALFSWRINVDGRPNRKKKAAFSNFLDVLSTGSGCSWLNIIGTRSSHIYTPSFAQESNGAARKTLNTMKMSTLVSSVGLSVYAVEEF